MTTGLKEAPVAFKFTNRCLHPVTSLTSNTVFLVLALALVVFQSSLADADDFSFLDGYWTSVVRSCEPLPANEIQDLHKSGGESYFNIATLRIDLTNSYYRVQYKNGLGCEEYGLGLHELASGARLFCLERDRITEGNIQVFDYKTLFFDGTVVQQADNGAYAALGIVYKDVAFQVIGGVLVLKAEGTSACGDKPAYQYFVPTPLS